MGYKIWGLKNMLKIQALKILVLSSLIERVI